MTTSLNNASWVRENWISNRIPLVFWTIFSVCLLLLFPAGVRCQETGIVVDSLNIGQVAPAFAISEIGTNDLVYLSDFTGALRTVARLRRAEKKIVILSFFASWCVNCPKEMKALTDISQEYEGNNIKVLFVYFGESDSLTAAWLAQNPNIKGTVLMDRGYIWAVKYGVSKLPRTIIIDKDRIVRFVEYGFNPDTYRTRVEEALESIIGPGKN